MALPHAYNCKLNETEHQKVEKAIGILVDKKVLTDKSRYSYAKYAMLTLADSLTKNTLDKFAEKSKQA